MAASDHIAVVGAGPVGTLVAAALLENGVDFTWVVRNPHRRKQLGDLSLQFPEASRSFSLDAIEVVDAMAGLPVRSRVIVATKAQDVDAVIGYLPGVAPDSVLTVCNGLRSGPWGLGLLYGGGFINSGVLVTNRENRLVAGGLGTTPEPWDWAVEALDCEFLSCTTGDNMLELMWHKLAVNCVVNPLTAMLDCDNGDLLGRLQGPLVGGIMRETLAVMAVALGEGAEAPTPAELLLEIKQVLQATRYNSSSMREDLRRGRATEIDQLNGAVISEGARLGLPCPVSALLVGMISLLGNAP